MDKKVTETGSKAYQRTDAEWRIKPYSDWHRTLSKKLLMLDIDFVEWRFKDGKLVPVGVMEVTRVDKDKSVTINYLNSIINRFEQRDIQARTTRMVASALNAKAYIILFREDCSEFWVYDLTDQKGWAHFDPKQMEEFLQGLS